MRKNIFDNAGQPENLFWLLLKKVTHRPLLEKNPSVAHVAVSESALLIKSNI